MVSCLSFDIESLKLIVNFLTVMNIFEIKKSFYSVYLDGRFLFSRWHIISPVLISKQYYGRFSLLKHVEDALSHHWFEYLPLDFEIFFFYPPV
jgi:hypothetical protein